MIESEGNLEPVIYWPNHEVRVDTTPVALFAICISCGARSGPFLIESVGTAAKECSDWGFRHNYEIFLAELNEREHESEQKED